MNAPVAYCAHLHISFRREDFQISEAEAAEMSAHFKPDGIHVPPRAGSTMTRGWWECDSGCGMRFAALAEVERLRGELAKAKRDTQLLDDVEACCITLRWESSDDPYAQWFVPTRTNLDGDATRVKLSGKFRGPVRQALRAAAVAVGEDFRAVDEDVWAPDFLKSRDAPPSDDGAPRVVLGQQAQTAAPSHDRGGGCDLAGPDRGDCEHFVGMPATLDKTTTDCYGKPHGWCWSCWKSHQIAELRAVLGQEGA